MDPEKLEGLLRSISDKVYAEKAAYGEIQTGTRTTMNALGILVYTLVTNYNLRYQTNSPIDEVTIGVGVAYTNAIDIARADPGIREAGLFQQVIELAGVEKIEVQGELLYVASTFEATMMLNDWLNKPRMSRWRDL